MYITIIYNRKEDGGSLAGMLSVWKRGNQVLNH